MGYFVLTIMNARRDLIVFPSGMRSKGTVHYDRP